MVKNTLLTQIDEILDIYANDEKKQGGYSMTEYYNTIAPEDYCEERTDWKELQNNADGMYYMLNEIRYIIEQMKDEIETDILIN